MQDIKTLSIPKEVVEELERRSEHLEKQIVVLSLGGGLHNLAGSLSDMARVMEHTGESLEEKAKAVQKSWDDLGEWNECQPVEMNPYQRRLPHTQNNNWRGNGKRKKRKGK